MFRVRCLHPKIIQNPLVNHVIKFCNVVHLFDSYKAIDDESRVRLLDGASVMSVFRIADYHHFPDFDSQFEYCSKFYLLNDLTGESYDLFQVVKCSHCSVCRESYVSSLRQRCMFQLESSHDVPLFITLTYDPSKQPIKGADVRSLQLFKKRLSYTLESLVSFRPILKFVVTSEVGKGGNLHYHMLVFGFPSLSSSPVENQYLRYHVVQYCWRQPQYLDKDKILTKSGKLKLWNPISFSDYKSQYPQVFKRPKDYDLFSYGFVNIKELDSSSKAVNYITKYVTKSIDDIDNRKLKAFDPVSKKYYYYKPKLLNDGTRPNFCIVSQNMGLDFVRKLRIQNDGSVVFTSWFDGVLHTVFLCSYFINKLFPSFVVEVPSYVRRAYDSCIINISRLLSSRFIDRDIRSSLLNTSIYLRNNWPYPLEINSYVADKSELLDDFELNCLLSSVAHHASIVYDFIINSDFTQIRKHVVERDRFLSLISSRKIDLDSLSSDDMHLRHQLKSIQSFSKI